jgi:hypothetical protein
MKKIIYAVLALASVAGCTSFRRSYEQGQAERQQSQARLASIPVTAGQYPGSNCRILGSIDYPGPGIFTVGLLGNACGPDDVRKKALDEYGHVTAITDFLQWNVSGQPHCGGNAVVCE